MYKLLLVDDRKDVVNRIKQAINWQKIGVVVYTAYNGAEALEEIERSGIDIVVTDIKMPKMTGLELVEICKNRNISCKFVLISGYEDFEYAKKALRYGVSDYLLKPIQVDDLTTAIEKIKSELEKEKQHTDFVAKIQAQEYQKELEEKNAYLQTLIESSSENNSLNFSSKKVNLCINENDCYLLLFYVEQSRDEQIVDDTQSLRLKRYALSNIAGEIFSTEFSNEVFSVDNLLIMLCNPRHGLREIQVQYNLYELSGEVQSVFRQHFKRDVTVVISERYIENEAVKNAYKTCKNLFDGQFRLKGGQLLLESEWHESESAIEYPKEMCETILRKFALGDLECTLQHVKEFFAKIANFENKSKTLHVSNLCKLLGEMFKQKAVEFPIVEISAKMMELCFFEQLQNYFIEMTTSLSNTEVLNVQTANSLENEMRKIEQYIETNYNKGITLKEISEHLYLSQSYISTTFKDIVGVNFNTYLTQVRIKHAKELLLSGRYKVYQVATEVGFQDAKYFSEVFKKYVGELPKEWLKQQKN